MFAKIAGFEFRYQLRQPLFWVVAVALRRARASSAALGQHPDRRRHGNVHKNSPFVIVRRCSTLFMHVLHVRWSPAFVASVIVRDDETGFGRLLFAPAVAQVDYLYGRFAGGVSSPSRRLSWRSPLGLLLGALMPWVDPETLGPTVFGDYV